MAYIIKIEPEAHQDIQEGIEWYNGKRDDLGVEFHQQIIMHFKTLEINPFFQIRYKDVRCLPVKNFPYMIHFTINETDNIVTIHSVFSTSQSPKKWTQRK